MSRWPGALLALLALPAMDTPAAAAGDDAEAAVDGAGEGRYEGRSEGANDAADEPDEAADAPEDAPEGMHGAVGVGGFVGLTGPGRYGLAAEAEVFPPWPLDVLGDRVGLGLRYRGWDGLARGLVVGGLVYEAGATRPHLTIELHGDVGLVYGTAGGNRLLLGGGVRTQLGVFGPVAVALHGDVYCAFENLRLRPHIVPAVTVGLAR